MINERANVPLEFFGSVVQLMESGIISTSLMRVRSTNETRTRPIGIRTTPSLSAFQSNVPDIDLIAPTMSSVTVPRRAAGMSPLGPRKRASLLIFGSRAGVQRTLVGMIFSDNIYKGSPGSALRNNFDTGAEEAHTESMSSSPPTYATPSFLAASACLPSANTRIFSSPVRGSWGSDTRPRGETPPFAKCVRMHSSYADLGERTSTACTYPTPRVSVYTDRPQDVISHLKYGSRLRNGHDIASLCSQYATRALLCFLCL